MSELVPKAEADCQQGAWLTFAERNRKDPICFSARNLIERFFNNINITVLSRAFGHVCSPSQAYLDPSTPGSPAYPLKS